MAGEALKAEGEGETRGQSSLCQGASGETQQGILSSCQGTNSSGSGLFSLRCHFLEVTNLGGN